MARTLSTQAQRAEVVRQYKADVENGTVTRAELTHREAGKLGSDFSTVSGWIARYLNKTMREDGTFINTPLVKPAASLDLDELTGKVVDTMVAAARAGNFESYQRMTVTLWGLVSPIE